MTNEFIPYEEALALKELGFNDECFGFYDDQYNKDNGLYLNDSINLKGRFISTKAPTFSQTFRWFRDEKSISGEVYSGDFGGCIEYSFHIRDLYTEKEIFDNFFGAGGSYSGTFNTYEEAELACLKKLIEIVKPK